jgi:hypothetical protein
VGAINVGELVAAAQQLSALTIKIIPLIEAPSTGIRCPVIDVILGTCTNRRRDYEQHQYEMKLLLRREDLLWSPVKQQ